VHDRADADPGTDRDVDEVIEALRRAPATLGERRAVDVGVEGDWHAERAQRREQVHLAPAGLGRRADAPITGLSGIQIQRSEARDAESREGPRRVPARQRTCDLIEGRTGLPCFDSYFLSNIVDAGRE
jgi:hypothetical protein